MRIGENAGYPHFLLFQQCFVPTPNRISVFKVFILLSANALNMDQSKNLLFGKGLRRILPKYYYRQKSNKNQLTFLSF